MQETDQFLDNLVSNWPILLAGQMKSYIQVATMSAATTAT